MRSEGWWRLQEEASALYRRLVDRYAEERDEAKADRLQYLSAVAERRMFRRWHAALDAQHLELVAIRAELHALMAPRRPGGAP